jgi:carbonic anhydrase
MLPKIDSVPATFMRDLAAGLVVFLVALPLCLGVALASGAPLFSGVLAGIIGGIVVGSLSGSQSSVSGPAAGLTAIVAVQIVSLGSFQTFLLAVMVAGLIQIGLGLARAGFIAAFFPSSVIKGLLAAIGRHPDSETDPARRRTRS